MNNVSKICSYIKEHPDTWRNDFDNLNILVKEDNNENFPLAIFNYGIGANFFDPIVCEARGIIINLSTLDVVCWPFNKFGKYNEPYAAKIDWNTARVEEKIDGSIVKLWYHVGRDEWIWSTNSCIYAKDAYCDADHAVTFYDLIQRSWELCTKTIDMFCDDLDKTKTYIFELTTPENIVVVHHRNYSLSHIGTRSNITGIEDKEYLGIKQPTSYDLNSIEGCLEALDFHNTDIQSTKIGRCSMEGFVVVDANWNRIKIKSPIYSVLHNITNGGNVSKELLLRLISENKLDIDVLCEEFPDIAHYISYYYYKYNEFVNRAGAFLNIARILYNESGNNRKIIALKVKDHKYSAIAFAGIGNDLSLRDIVSRKTKDYAKGLAKCIETYEPECFDSLFK